MEIPYTVTARPDTGLWNAKIGIWLFLASEVMLFGGLFSAYIFLRLDADYPWPVQVLVPVYGFINTLVLIFSSVTVLQAWIAVKMRKFAQFRIWMFLTIACAGAFMVIKSIEYNDKFHHYGVRLQDGSTLEGHLPKGHLVKFGDVKSITLMGSTAEQGTFNILGKDLTFGHVGSHAGFLSFLTEGKLEVQDADGKSFTLDAAKVGELVSKARNAKPKQDKIVLKVTAPVKFSIAATNFFGRNTLIEYDGGKAIFRDGTVIEGKLEDDTMHLETDKVDLRRLFPHDETELKSALAAVDKADAWRILGDEWKEKFLKHISEKVELFHKDHPGQKFPMKNGDFVRTAFTMPIGHHEAGAEHEAKPAPKGEHKAEAAAPHAAAEAHETAGGHAHPEFAIAKKDIAFYSNFTPKYNTYFAIYFALTGLHGLHVLAGMLVLSHFMIFGGRIYKKNPEHLANRVETGGLFWHFVDLVWIFLFPLLYLM